MKSSYVPPSALGTTIEPSEMTLGAGVGTGILSRPVFATTATAAGTTTLTVESASTQEFTGSTYHSVGMPSVDTLVAGWATLFINKSTDTITIRPSNGSSVITFLSAGQSVSFVCNDIAGGNGAAAWDVVGQSQPLWLAAHNDAVTASNATETDLTWTDTIGNMTGALAIGGPNYGVFTAPTNGKYTFRMLLQYESTDSLANTFEGQFVVRLTQSNNTLIKVIRSGGVTEMNSATPYAAGTDTPEWTLSLIAGDTVKVRVTYSDEGNGNGLIFYAATCQLKITQEL